MDGATDVATKGVVLRRAQARWYDLLAAMLTLGRDRQLRERLVRLARLTPGESVLDVGCGTGTLALAAQRAVGDAGSVVGVDASPDMVALAKDKAARRASAAEFQVAAAERLPFPDASFDVVFATLMLHHLPAPTRRACLREARRVLRPGGRMLAVDFATPSLRRGGVAGWLHRHGGVPTEELLALFRTAGFHVAELGSVGVTDLQYVLGEFSTEDRPERSLAAPSAPASLPPLSPARWIVPAIGGVAIAAHLAVAWQIGARVTTTAAGVALAVVGVAVLVMHRPHRR